jgi:hypothetical protein
MKYWLPVDFKNAGEIRLQGGYHTYPPDDAMLRRFVGLSQFFKFKMSRVDKSRHLYF